MKQTPTMKQIYHAFMDTEHSGRNEVVVNVNGSDVEIDWIMCDMITRILEIPGVREAVIVAALRHDLSDDGYVGLKEDGLERVSDIPFQFVWDCIMNEANSSWGTAQKEEN